MLKKYISILNLCLLSFLVFDTQPVWAKNSFVILNMDQVFANSLVGKDLAKQISLETEALKKLKIKVENELKAQVKKIESQKSFLSPETLQVKVQELRANEVHKKKELAEKVKQVESASAKAQKQVLDILAPILKKNMKEKQADAVFERRNILIGNPDIDITEVTIKQLDEQIKTLKLNVSIKN